MHNASILIKSLKRIIYNNNGSKKYELNILFMQKYPLWYYYYSQSKQIHASIHVCQHEDVCAEQTREPNNVLRYEEIHDGF